MVVQGIIRPPPEIRAVADKTASFVAKNGRGFETRIMNSAKGKTPKFAFLHESSPFHAYYEDRIVFYSNGGVDEEKKEEGVTDTKQSDQAGEGSVVKQEQDQAVSGPASDGKEKMMARKAKSIVDPVARALLAQRSRIQKVLESESNEEQLSSEQNDESSASTEKDILIPPQQKYNVLLAPNNISLAQLEVIKLTAQFAALNGKNGSFLRDLTVREWNNPFWGFLQPRHSHYAYFTQLIELYRRLLQEAVLIYDIEMKQRSNDIRGNQISLLEIAKIKDVVGLDGGAEEQDNIKSQIDLIQNTAGDVYKCLEYSAYHAEYDRFHEEKRRKELESMEGSGGLGGTARIDWHDFVVVETINFHVDEVVESLPPPPPPLPDSLKSDEMQAKEAARDMEESSDEDEEGESIKVVEGYTPKVVSSQAKFSSESMTHVIDPITKKSIAISDMTEHMRIQLLDPKWAAEKAKFLEKQKESNLVGGDEIARNMMTFAKGRTDFFGTTALEDEESRKRFEANNAAYVEPQMPQPRPAITTAASSMNTAFPTHAKPELVAPDAKRLKLETTSAYGNVPIPPIQPFMVPPPPPPPVATPVTTFPPTSQVELEPDQDTVTMETTMSEIEFAKSLSNPNVPLLIKIPNDSNYAAWNFCGQTISITVDVMTTIKDVKQQVQSQLGGIPPNKMQLRKSNIGFLKDSLSLAYYNVGPGNNILELLPKVRGGRR
mmetsp:Transcript_2006/g.3640  ORF Transcript_2006/g.3640 Transcript_2006/m.3640 type:complete len:717 (+) Transcript_2006:90-2240(+)